MSDTLWNEAYTKEYSNRLILEAQQDSKLAGIVTDAGRIQAEEKFFYKLDAYTGTINRDRYQATSEYRVEPNYEARRIQDYVLSLPVWFDSIDKARTILEPQSPNAVAMRKGIARLRDQIVWNGILGTTLGSGANTYSLGAANTVAATVGASSGNAGMNFEKVLAGHQTFMDNHVDFDMDTISLVIHPQGWNELLQEEKMTSGDYVTSDSIMRGKINNVLGIDNIIVTPTVPYVDGSDDPIMDIGASWNVKGTAADAAGGTDIRCCTLVAKSGVQMGTWRDASMTLDRLPQQSNAYQLFLEEQCGSARTEDEKVVKILSDDSPA
jgi:hypothetical protein